MAAKGKDKSETATASERRVPVRKFSADAVAEATDSVAVEEPLEIRIGWPGQASNSAVETLNIAVTMRTPGNDAELALGFLFTEGLIPAADAVADVLSEPAANRVTVMLHAMPESGAAALQRNFYMTSSCGVCGKASIDSIRTHAQFPTTGAGLQVTADSLVSLPHRLERYQTVFRGTGSIHAAALFDAEGLLPEVYEDVGRHNAVDKLIGATLRAGQLPLHRAGLLVSGRASFELVQKARMAGCAILASVGAPSSLAIDLAWDSDMTLIGFLRDGRFNVYAGPARIIA